MVLFLLERQLCGSFYSEQVLINLAVNLFPCTCYNVGKSDLMATLVCYLLHNVSKMALKFTEFTLRSVRGGCFMVH